MLLIYIDFKPVRRVIRIQSYYRTIRIRRHRTILYPCFRYYIWLCAWRRCTLLMRRCFRTLIQRLYRNWLYCTFQLIYFIISYFRITKGLSLYYLLRSYLGRFTCFYLYFFFRWKLPYYLIFKADLISATLTNIGCCMVMFYGLLFVITSILWAISTV